MDSWLMRDTLIAVSRRRRSGESCSLMAVDPCRFGILVYDVLPSIRYP